MNQSGQKDLEYLYGLVYFLGGNRDSQVTGSILLPVVGRNVVILYSASPCVRLAAFQGNLQLLRSVNVSRHRAQS